MLETGMAIIIEVLKTHGQVTITCIEVWRSSNDLLSLFGMDPLRDIKKYSSTQMIIEDVDTRRNLSQREIKVTSKILLKRD